MSALYPLSFRPILLPKVWGGRELARFGKVLPDGEPIGESWEIADLAETSITGAGGAAARSIVAHGPLAGTALGELVSTRPTELLGSVMPRAPGGFPLLVKFLDAGEHLSLQVHPPEVYAVAHPGVRVKHETWYIVHARPDAVLFKGIREGVDGGALAEATARGRVLEVVESVPARAGDCHHLPSGTVHALGAGIVVAEIQTPSDTTYRLYDWNDVYDRPTRPVQIREALACAHIGSAPPTTRASDDEAHTRLARCSAYDLWEVRVESGQAVDHPVSGEGCFIAMVMAGTVTAPPPPGGEQAVSFAVGSTILVPASRRADHGLASDSGGVVLTAGPV